MTIIPSPQYQEPFYLILNKNCNLFTGVRLPLDRGDKIPINLFFCLVQQWEQKSLISLSQVAELRPGGDAVHQSCFDQVPSSAYNQTVQWAIKEDDDGLEDSRRPRYCCDKQKQQMNQSAGCLVVVPACLPLWLAAAPGQVQMGSGNLRLSLHAPDTPLQRRGRKMKMKMSFQPPKKTDNVPSKEKHSLFWWETAGVLPIRCWIYTITVIRCWWLGFFSVSVMLDMSL